MSCFQIALPCSFAQAEGFSNNICDCLSVCHWNSTKPPTDARTSRSPAATQTWDYCGKSSWIPTQRLHISLWECVSARTWPLTGNKPEFKELQHTFMLITGRTWIVGNSLMNDYVWKCLLKVEIKIKWGGKFNMRFGLNMSLIVRLTQLLSHMLKSHITFHSLQQHLSRGNRPERCCIFTIQTGV